MIKIWGHRGCKGERAGGKGFNPPENSLASFKEAIRQGADGFELDVFLTRDNQLVVFHDDTLERMTNGEGKITDHTLAELKELRLKGATGKLTEQRIPTLDEVLDLVDRFRHEHPKRGEYFTVNIEIKEMPGKNIAEHVAGAIDRRLKSGWTKDNFQVSSFDMGSLRAMRRARPDIPIGALFEGPVPPREPWDIDESLLNQRIAETRDIHPDTINITLPSMTPKAVEMIRATGARPVAWTSGEINPEILMQNGSGRAAAVAAHILESELAVMITDYPQEMRALVDQHAIRPTGRSERPTPVTGGNRRP